MEFAEMMFYAEVEGLLPTRTGRINAIIKNIKNYPAPYIDESTFETIVKYCGIDPISLTQRELKRIESAIK